MMDGCDLDFCTVALASQVESSTGRTWVHLMPAGQFSGRDGRGPYRLDDPAAVMTASQHYAGQRAIPVDYDHQIDRAAKNGVAAPAAGWISGLQNRRDGIWGLVEWTARAAGHLAQREYRYLSPAFLHTSEGRVTCILRAALTNNPNLDQLTALASRETFMDQTTNDLTELRTLLGLPPAAGVPAILAKVREVMTTQQAAEPDPAAYVPIGELIRVTAELNRVNQGVTLQAAQTAVEAEINGGRMPPYLRDWAVKLCTVNKPAYDTFIAKTGRLVHRIFEPSGATAGPPPFATSHLSDEERHVSAALGHTHDEFRKGGRS